MRSNDQCTAVNALNCTIMHSSEPPTHQTSQCRAIHKRQCSSMRAILQCTATRAILHCNAMNSHAYYPPITHPQNVYQCKMHWSKTHSFEPPTDQTFTMRSNLTITNALQHVQFCNAMQCNHMPTAHPPTDQYCTFVVSFSYTLHLRSVGNDQSTNYVWAFFTIIKCPALSCLRISVANSNEKLKVTWNPSQSTVKGLLHCNDTMDRFGQKWRHQIDGDCFKWCYMTPCFMSASNRADPLSCQNAT